MMLRFFLQSFLVFALNLGLSSAGRTAEITGFRVVSPGQVEITFASNAGVHYDVLGSEDLRTFTLLTRVPGSREQTRVVVKAQVGQVDRRFFGSALRSSLQPQNGFMHTGGQVKSRMGITFLPVKMEGFSRWERQVFYPIAGFWPSN